MTGSKPSVRVLFVCTGNICRSPTAEGVFRAMAHAVGLGDRIEADSAGTGRWTVGQPPDGRAQETAFARGIDIGDLRARRVRADDFDRFDYIVAMDRSHQRDLLRLAPAGAEGRVRLLMEFADHGGILDVPDPYLGALGGFDHVFALIEAGSAGLLREIRAVLSKQG